MPSIAVIGGGITGVTTAYALARRGLQVTLFERHRYPAMETSFANGGQLSASNAEVWNSWSTVRKGMAWMLRNDAPLLVSPRPGWHKLSWFAEFLAAIPRYESNTIACTRLAIAAREHLFAWAHEEGIQFDQRQQGILHVCRDKAGFEHAARVSSLLARGGLERRAVTPREMQAIEPTLAGQFYGGFFTESDSTGDIHQFTLGLAQAAARRGVQMVCGAEVRRLTPGAGKASGSVRVDYLCDGHARVQDFEALVVCAGTASRELAAMLGDRVNVYPVKGYSITVMLDDAASRAAAPENSLVDDAAKLVSSRLGSNRLRVAGTAEFNGFNRDIRADRVAPLVQWVQQSFPGVSTRQVMPWAGLRPMMPDLVPRVGPGKRPGVFYNTGHGHLGWTLSAATAELVAAQVLAAVERTATRLHAALAV